MENKDLKTISEKIESIKIQFSIFYAIIVILLLAQVYFAKKQFDAKKNWIANHKNIKDNKKPSSSK